MSKALIVERGLNAAEQGGLSSYALVLMATSLMQMQASLGGEVHGAGPLLLRFLQARCCVLWSCAMTAPPLHLLPRHPPTHPPAAHPISPHTHSHPYPTLSSLSCAQVFGSPPEPRDGASLHAVLLDEAKTLHVRPVPRRLLSAMSPDQGTPGACGIALLVQVGAVIRIGQTGVVRRQYKGRYSVG